MVSADQCYGDTEESVACAESLLVVVLVTEHVVEPTEPGEGAAEYHRPRPHAPDPNAAVLRRVRLKSHGAKLVTGPRAKQIPPYGEGGRDREKDRGVCGRPFEHRGDRSEPRDGSRMYFRRMQRLGDMNVCRHD